MDPTNKYADIINLPHHTSPKRARKPMSDRAAQFSPFAALTGYEEAIEETGRLTEQKIELDEETKMELNQKLMWISEHIKDNPYVTITYYVPDKAKTGGAYVQKSGHVRRIDEVERKIIFTDQTRIGVDAIFQVAM